jgi:hypothetical protein
MMTCTGHIDCVIIANMQGRLGLVLGWIGEIGLYLASPIMLAKSSGADFGAGLGVPARIFAKFVLPHLTCMR